MSNFARKLRKPSKPSRFGESQRAYRKSLTDRAAKIAAIEAADREHQIDLLRWGDEGGPPPDPGNPAEPWLHLLSYVPAAQVAP